ncbi:hypothetical protein Dimus_005451 [Dionaea muscipula]
MYPNGGRSFVEVVKKGNKMGTEPLTVRVHSIGNGWFYRIAVAKFGNHRASEHLMENFVQQSDRDILVRRMGDNQALLTFSTKEKMEIFIDNHNKAGSHWFSSVSPWSVDLISGFGREVWLSRYGVPIHAWNCLCHIPNNCMERSGKLLTGDDAPIESEGRNEDDLTTLPNLQRSVSRVLDQIRDGANSGFMDHAAAMTSE